MAVQDATNAKLRETCDRLALLLIALPREGWELEFRTITHRKIYRQTLLEENEAGHDEQS
jgi:hypothetical protein